MGSSRRATSQGTFEGGGHRREELTKKYLVRPSLLQLPDRVRPGDALAGRPFPGEGRAGVRDHLLPGLQLRVDDLAALTKANYSATSSAEYHQHGMRDRVRHELVEKGHLKESRSACFAMGDGHALGRVDPDDALREGRDVLAGGSRAWLRAAAAPNLQ